MGLKKRNMTSIVGETSSLLSSSSISSQHNDTSTYNEQHQRLPPILHRRRSIDDIRQKTVVFVRTIVPTLVPFIVVVIVVVIIIMTIVTVYCSNLLFPSSYGLGKIFSTTTTTGSITKGRNDNDLSIVTLDKEMFSSIHDTNNDYDKTYSSTNNNNNNNNNNKNTKNTKQFNNDFIFGVSTSSYQIEGNVNSDGRGTTIWDTFCHEALQSQKQHIQNNDTGDDACNHYQLYKQDVQLLKQLNVHAYRFSIAWSRIIPTGYYSDGINQAGINFYNNLITELLINNIEPWITLYHWDLPQQLETNVNGWLDTTSTIIINEFGNYARLCFQLFGNRVKNWITINEPWTIAVHGYNDGIKAPGHSNNGQYETYKVGHNLLLAHAKAVHIYKSDFFPTQQGRIGIANSADYRYPLNNTNDNDINSATRAMLFQFGWFIDPLVFGDYPTIMRQRIGNRLPNFTKEQSRQLQGSYDFLGINTYSSALVSTPEQEYDWNGYWADMFITSHNDPTWKINSMRWPIVPYATHDLLQWISTRYNYPLLYITENGIPDDDNDDTADYVNDVTVQNDVHVYNDYNRINFIQEQLRACFKAMEYNSLIQLKGYFVWSLMDNFEWEYGYTKRFGLYYVNFTSQIRIPKTSIDWYRTTILTKGRTIFMS